MISGMPKSPAQQPKAPAFGQPPAAGQGFGQGSGQMLNTQAPAVNKGALLAGLTRAGKFRPETGTATGNRAAGDFAKSMAYQSAADAGRSVSIKNAETMAQRQQANEQLYEAKRANQLAGYQQAVRQSMSNADLANQLSMWRNNMSANWRNFAIGLLG